MPARKRIVSDDGHCIFSTGETVNNLDQPDSGASPHMPLGAGFVYADLFSPHGLLRLHNAWRQQVSQQNPTLLARFDTYRASEDLPNPEVSELLCDLAATLAPFLCRLIPDLAEPLARLREQTTRERQFGRYKEEIVKRRVGKAAQDAACDSQFVAALFERHGVTLEPNHLPDELPLAQLCLSLLDAGQQTELAALVAYLAKHKEALKQAGHQAFSLPQPVVYDALVPHENRDGVLSGLAGQNRPRDGFGLTDRLTDHLNDRARPLTATQADYCLLCHKRDRDSCQKGLRDKTGQAKKNPLGVPLLGCPLKERISEMNARRLDGDPLGALALVMLSNPMCAGTGYRICNDCEKACVFQKQDPVDVPAIETGVLLEVLSLPWGVEIYGLLQRWKPLSKTRPTPLPWNGRKVLVVGLGPAGYTLCHYLCREGFAVVGIDGLKLEPLPPELTGDTLRDVWPMPVRDFASLSVPLDKRPKIGFGGVSEYGITVRWDKNFLTLLYLLLLREPLVQFVGGVRFGGTLTLDDAWSLGFDHVALCTGSGRPTLVPMENNLCRGIRQASDFLMALQLSSAGSAHSLANLQVRLPALVVGGGLTAVDTATELAAYYVVQTEKMLARWETLCQTQPEAALLARFDPEETLILQEFLQHGRAFRASRQAAQGRPPQFAPLIDQFGGVSLIYRKELADSPAYRLNHKELIKCLEEGVRFIEKLQPEAALTDEFSALRAVRFEKQQKVDGGFRGTGQKIELAARTLCIAAGTVPNTMYEKEYPNTAALGPDGYFVPHRAEHDGRLLRADPDGFFTSYERDGHVVSFFGDNHPRYAGAVVRAMASAQLGYPHIAALFSASISASEGLLEHPAQTHNRGPARQDLIAFFDRLQNGLVPEVVSVVRLTPSIVEVTVRAPFAARKFQPGQFFRLQNFEALAQTVGTTRLLMENLALTGARADKEAGTVSLIVLETGGSSSLCQQLRPGERVVLLGPTGAPTEIPHNETVCLLGGGLGNAVLFSIAQALKQNGCRVLYLAGYKTPQDLFDQTAIEAAADQVVWCCDTSPTDSAFGPRRPQDRLFVGNLVEAFTAFAQGRLGPRLIEPKEVDRFIVIGSDRMMAAVAKARHTVWQPYVQNPHQTIALGSINSPMQCMMKEICAQCVQKHHDPATGKETFVYTCANQDQPLDRVVWPHLAARLRQNSVQEKLTALWIAHVLHN